MDINNLGKIAGDSQQLEALPEIWNDVKGKDWHGFYERIEGAKAQGKGDPHHLDQLKSAGQEAQANGQPFPDSLSEFSGIIGRHLH
jgi:hypothetical protein